MPMKNPPHPGDLIRTEIIEALGLTVSKASGILRVRRATDIIFAGVLGKQLPAGVTAEQAIAALRAAGATAHSAVYPGEHDFETLEAHLEHMLAFAGHGLSAAR